MKTRELNDEISLNKNFRIDGFCKIVRGNTGLKKDELLDAGDYVALQYGKTYKVDVVDETFNFFVNEEYFKESQVVNQGDTILISTSETIEDLGHSCFYDRNDLGLLGGEQILLKPKNNSINGKYLYYFSKFLKAELQKYATGLKVFRFNIDDIKKLSFDFPPKPEQTAIANYIDRKTSTIDKKTALLNQKIETYKKLRKAIINKAVTKGLDNKVELRESDLGFSVPVHWKKVRLKDIGNLYSGLSGKSGDDFNQEDNLNNKSFIPFTNIANNTYLDKEHLGTVVVGENENQNAVKKGDIFFLMSSEGYDDIGKTAVLVDDLKGTYLNSFCKGFRINKTKTNSNFLNYALLSDFYRKRMIVEGKGFTRINLKMEKVSNFEMNLPTDVKEQRQIAEYLDQKTATIDKIVENLQTQITTFQHLRKVLINDAVTGKIKVV